MRCLSFLFDSKRRGRDPELIYNRKQLKALILPLMFEQFLNVMVGMVDTLMVSKAGEAAVSGVALTTNINLLIIQVMAALATGGAVVCSQYNGRKDTEEATFAAAQLETVLLVFSVAAALICAVFGHRMLPAIFGKVEEMVMHSAWIYMFVTALSYPFLGVYNAGAAIFRSVGNSKVSMILSVLMNAINIVLNAVLVMMGYGVLGVALATLVSRIVCGICMVILVTKPYNPLQLKRLRELLPNRKMITRILRIGIPSGIENSMFQVGKLMVVSMITKFGTAAIAANSVSYSVIEFPNIPGMSMGLALITVVGNCLGAGEIEQAKKYTKKLMVLAYAGDWIMNALLFVFAPQVVGVFSLSKEATDMAVEVLRWFSSVAVFIWPLSFTLPNALRAAGDVKFTMLTGIISMWLFRVLCSYLLAVVCNMGILGVWFGMFIDWAVRSLLFVVRYLSGRWQMKKVI